MRPEDKNPLLSIARALAAASLALGAAAAGAQVIKLVPFMQTGLAVHAVIDGQAGDFLFDTGGGVSFVTPEFARRIGCTPWGQITGFRMSGERLDMQHCNSASVQVAGRVSNLDSLGVVDLKRLFPPDAKLDIDGALALDLFDDKIVSFSQRDRTLVVSESVPESLKGCDSMPIHLVRTAEGLSLTVDLPVRTSAGLAWFELDSGNLSATTLVNKAIADKLGLRPDVPDPQASALTLGDGQVFATKAVVLGLILDGNLGTSFLSTHDVTLDLKKRRAWIVAKPGTPCLAGR